MARSGAEQHYHSASIHFSSLPGALDPRQTWLTGLAKLAHPPDDFELERSLISEPDMRAAGSPPAAHYRDYGRNERRRYR